MNITENILEDLKVIPVDQQELYVKSVAEIYRSLTDLLLQKNPA